MKTKTYHFTSVRLDKSYVQLMTVDPETHAFKAFDPEKFGYVLIGQRLVPWTFINYVKNALSDLSLYYDDVLTESALFDEDFLNSLDAEERAVLMPCLMVLIEFGEFGVNLCSAPVPEDEAADSTEDAAA